MKSVRNGHARITSPGSRIPDHDEAADHVGHDRVTSPGSSSPNHVEAAAGSSHPDHVKAAAVSRQGGGSPPPVRYHRPQRIAARGLETIHLDESHFLTQLQILVDDLSNILICLPTKFIDFSPTMRPCCLFDISTDSAEI